MMTLLPGQRQIPVQVASMGRERAGKCVLSACHCCVAGPVSSTAALTHLKIRPLHRHPVIASVSHLFSKSGPEPSYPFCLPCSSSSSSSPPVPLLFTQRAGLLDLSAECLVDCSWPRPWSPVYFPRAPLSPSHEPPARRPQRNGQLSLLRTTPPGASEALQTTSRQPCLFH